MIVTMSCIHLLYMYLIGARKQDVVYAAVLDAILLLITVLVGFFRYSSKVKALSNALERPVEEQAQLPEATDDVEILYHRLLENQSIARSESESSAAIRQSQMRDYYSMWVHQIKTPIASMNLMLQSVDSQLSRRLSGELFKIEQYVEMVLAFVRLDSNYSDYVFKNCDIDGVIRQSVKKFAHDFIYRRISLDFKETGLKAVTDEKWLGFVIDQLISNSLKYTKDGTISIYLKAPDVLCIQDTGIGIAPEDLPRVFDKGYTGYNGRKDKKASGLGLYLCKKICARLGLKIYLESKPGEGTRVMIDFEQYKLNAE